MVNRLHIFDCDGVLALSNRLKTHAFDLVASKYLPRDLVDEFIDFHQTNGGVSRWDKFEHLLKISKPYILPTIDELSNQFSFIVQNGLNSVAPVPGAKKFIENLSRKGEVIYVVSGGEQKQVKKLISILNLRIDMKNIFGSPTRKITHFKNIRKKYKNFSVMTYGDSALDAKCAYLISSEFTFVTQDSEASKSEIDRVYPEKFITITNFLNPKSLINV
tara:strand:- start:3301 stop:3954 length:654 start_codon:yes stop_codon:yes gene_type:complete